MNDREKLLKELMALDFTLIDLHLFLDTHPYDRQVIELYNKTLQQRNELKNKYETQYGPLVSNCFESTCPWQWIQGPWPWEICR